MNDGVTDEMLIKQASKLLGRLESSKFEDSPPSEEIDALRYLIDRFVDDGGES